MLMTTIDLIWKQDTKTAQVAIAHNKLCVHPYDWTHLVVHLVCCIWSTLARVRFPLFLCSSLLFECLAFFVRIEDFIS